MKAHKPFIIKNGFEQFRTSKGKDRLAKSQKDDAGFLFVFVPAILFSPENRIESNNDRGK
jgi:hypothetical protein